MPSHNFHDLLGSLSVADFFASHWEKSPAVLNPTNDLTQLFTMDNVEGAVLAAAAASSPARLAPYAVRSHQGTTEEFPLARDPDGTPTMGSIYRAFHAGYTIVADHIGRSTPAISELCASAESHLQHPVGCNLFLTPPQSQGFVPHYDSMETFFIQIDGSKQWSVWPPHVELPYGSGFDKPNPATLGAPALTVDLHVGQVLYLPRGWTHAGDTSETHSLHLTLGVTTWRWVDLLTAQLANLAQTDPRLRQSVPLSHHQDVPRDSLQQDAADLLADVISSIAERTSGDALTEMIAASLRHRRSTSRPHLASTFIAPLRAESILEPHDGLRPVITNHGDTATLHFAGGFVEGPAEAAAALSFVAERDVFSVGSLPGLHFENQQALAQALITEGFAKVVDP